MKNEFRYALAGNPNCGKTTLFNALTGSRQYVGNWPGVTVEKKEGRVLGSVTASLVDLPGIYSLSPYSPEELITRNFILEEKPDLILNIVDATNPERNLYLTLQLAELGLPMVIAWNMIDAAERNGVQTDCDLLQKLLGFPVIPISASKGIGIQALLDAAEKTVLAGTDRKKISFPEIYTGELQAVIHRIETLIEPYCIRAGMPLRWSAVKWAEGDAPVIQRLAVDSKTAREAEKTAMRLKKLNMERDMLVADCKYRFICSVTEKAIQKSLQTPVLSRSDKADRILTNKYLGMPLFLLIMLLVFYLTFGALGANLTDLTQQLFNVRLAEFTRNALAGIGASGWLSGLICDGIIGGIGAVLSFFPQITLLFFFLSVLEDSGYMARAAFIMDRALRMIGLSGRAFVPMLMGFGCSVPAIMATRTLENEKHRRITLLLIPYMSCSAKMPVYSLFIMAFFPKHRGLVVASLYLLGMLIAVCAAFILQKMVLHGEKSSFVMELPPYRMPTAKTLGLHLLEKIKGFITKAGTVLLAASTVVWFCGYFDFSLRHVSSGADSISGVIGAFLAPVFRPLGFGDWKSAVAVLSGLIARESTVSTIGILNGFSEGASAAAVMQSLYTPASAYAFMTFSLLSVPCIAAVTALRRELNSRKRLLAALGLQSAIAWGVTFLIYNTCKIFM